MICGCEIWSQATTFGTDDNKAKVEGKPEAAVQMTNTPQQSLTDAKHIRDFATDGTSVSGNTSLKCHYRRYVFPAAIEDTIATIII